MFIKEHQNLLNKYKKEYTPTGGEVLFENILKEYNIKYMKQKGFVAKCNTCLIADFYIPKPYKIIFEIDGKYHLNRKDKDYGRDKFFFIERGIKTFRFTNEEVEDISYIKSCLDKIFL